MTDAPSSSSLSSCETSTKGHLAAWREAWLDRRCSVLGLMPQRGLTAPSPTGDPGADAELRWQAYDVETTCELRPWIDRANGLSIWHWLSRLYREPDRLHELSLRARPMLQGFRVPFGTFSVPIRVPASEIARPLLWRSAQ